ncbi:MULTISPECIES: cytochrome c oxidase subunit II [Azospirillaceae]|jgi:cytochrome c oxidase subunit 2|uniref:cytochrome c oxidase subunit II n=1 Tax=Azospirillaceae TaxID=2829815 RepID=UPI000B6B486B|nr:MULTISPECIES: cytochrome c oxidase subunit II [Azospirillaceae]MDG5494697.1 cytochrome c oxidase subunit II [Niveispirillum sp. BGYR6]SNS22645.1 cytochrome c oxidase subunit 2 [Azospirillum sp. RU38E]SNS40678.1 cytochrome c oxidase subunit 2 [Azospirillum sp. RU37A]
MFKRKIGAALSGLSLAVFTAGSVMAQEAAKFVGVPAPAQLGMQEAASPVMERLHDFHNLLLVTITAIALFVTALLVYVMIRFNRRANPVPSTTTHHTLLEVAWTGIPVIILLLIAVPSFRLLYFMDKAPNPELTVKVTGHQWYWSFEYPDHEGVAFDARMIEDKDLKPGQHRLLEVDQRIIVPVDTDIRVLVTGADVIHSFAIPSLGMKKDAVPGRLNETWFRANREGVFYGQCSEICGTGHGQMPVAIEAVSKEAFQQWLGQQKQALNNNGSEPRQLAQAAGAQ